ncbi:hypothetical protein ANCDUO_00829 [Ancylostoma duodenale]|uniref:DNA2/NAM7 helicase-like C-terminal domain-containing protein n=1 Tax=Ancylostoma duodenale TaxID=51022 RepID=A0A0C2E0G3_9BILA|nr:hypothetical protein ANCDUO_00829 [Ancylostoma duodenale]
MSLSSQSALTIANEHESAPVCPVRMVYRPHIEMMRLNSHLFYEETLFCGTRASKRSNLLDHVTMPNPVVPIPFVDDLHSNETETRAVNALARFLIAHGIQATDVMAICLYTDQKMLCERILWDSGVFVATVDSAQGTERSVVIVCTTRTQFEQANITSFFTDQRRVNVALSRAKDGLFIIGAVSALSRLPLWA